MDTQTPLPGLIRMIVVDSNILPGRIDEVPLDGHTVVLAENGSGKTSLIQLVPVFYGEKMSAVVNSRERDSFIGHYLPRQSSYLAFEYRNQRGEIRSVVIHSDAARERLQYRFVRGGLSEEMFVVHDEGEVSFVSSSGFHQRLRALGIDHASRLVTSTRSYRHIIQGSTDDTADSRDRAYYSSLAADYAHTDRKAPLSGIEKILTQMLRNSVSMKSLLGVVARQSIESDKDTFHILGSSRREDVAAWPRAYQGYRRVMDAEPLARKAHAKKIAADDARAEITGRLAALSAFERDLIEGIAEQTRALEALQAEEGTAGEGYRARIAAADDALSALKARKKALAGEIDRMKSRDAELRRRGAEAARAKVDSLPGLRGQADSARTRREALGSKGAEIARRFDAARGDIEAAARDATQRLDTDAEAGRAKLDKEFEDFDLAQRGLIREIGSHGAERRKGIDNKILTLQSERDQVQQDLTEISPDPRIVSEHAALETRHAEMLADVAKNESEQRAAADRLKDATHALEISSRDREAAERKLSAANRAHEQVTLEVTPKPGTLLAALRSGKPDWSESVGKVIRPELLQMTGLAPTFDEVGQGLYGMEIDLDRIDVPPRADETIGEDRLQKASEAVDQAKSDLDRLTKAVDGHGRDRAKAQKSLGEADALLERSRRKLEAARADLEVKTEEKAASLAARQEGLKTRRSEIDESMAGLRAQVKTEQKEVARRIADAEASIDAARVRRDDGHRARRADLDKARADIKMTRDKDLASLDSQRAAALRQEGLDADVLAAVDAEIARLDVAITEARAARELAESWEAHQASMSGLPAREEKKAQLGFDIKAAESDLAGLKSERDQALKAIETRRAGLRGAKETFEDDLSRVQRVLNAEVGSERPVPLRETAHAEGLDANLTQLRRRQADYSAAEAEARKLVKQISGIFHGCGSEGISAYLASQDLGSPSMDWVPAIIRWYDHDHLAPFEGLMSGLEAIIQPILQSFQQLRAADDGIRRANRKLGEAIRSNPGFPHVRDVELSIASHIRHQPFWEDMEALEAAFAQWRNTDGRQPSESLVEALVAFLEHWKSEDDPVLHIEEMIYLKGRMVERGHERRFGRHTDLSDLSSNGNIIVLRLILFTALLSVMRAGREMRLVWAVDEIGALDVENTRSLLDMLAGNDIALLTAAPNLDRRVKHAFDHQMRIQDRQLYRLGSPHAGIREWLADDQLDYPRRDDGDDSHQGEGDPA